MSILREKDRMGPVRRTTISPFPHRMNSLRIISCKNCLFSCKNEYNQENYIVIKIFLKIFQKLNLSCAELFSFIHILDSQGTFKSLKCVLKTIFITLRLNCIDMWGFSFFKQIQRWRLNTANTDSVLTNVLEWRISNAMHRARQSRTMYLVKCIF